jgi:chromosome segregation ATPase
MQKELDNERRLRADRDLKIEMLEQEVRSTQAKCNYLEAKYQSVAAQVDGMVRCWPGMWR